MEFDVVIEIPRGSRKKYEIDHILCVPAGDVRQEHLRDLKDVAEFYRLEIHHFFQIYKELEPGKSVNDTSWADQAAAEAEVDASRRRLREHHSAG